MKDKSKRSTTLILYLLSIAAFFSSLNQNIYSPMIPLIRDSFEVSIYWVNLTVSGFIFITAVMQIVLGLFIDSNSQRWLLLLSLGITSISTIICAFAPNFVVFFIARIIQAIGAAMIPLISVNMTAMMFKGEERGDAMGTYQILITLAPAVAPILGGVIGQYYGYSGVFLFLFAISLALLLFCSYQLPVDKHKKSFELKGGFSKYRIVLSNLRGNNILAMSFFVFFVYFAILTYLPVLLHDHYHVSLQMIGLLYLPLTVSMIIGSILFKKLQRKFTLKKLYIITLLLMPLLVIIFGFIHEKTIVGLSVILFLYGILLGFSPPLLATMISNEYSRERGAALGLFNFIRYFGMAIGAVMMALHIVVSPSFLLVAFGLILFGFSFFSIRFLKISHIR